jgi:tetratricopeptide (TPR) repeat protein
VGKSEIVEQIDGLSVLRQFLEELWVELSPSLAKLSDFQQSRLSYIRDELLELKEPTQIAHYLGFIAHAFETAQVSQTTIISIYQFALQCQPTYMPALDASIRIFSRLNRWSMVLKLLKLKSTKGTAREKVRTFYEMAHVYLGFYGSEKGLNSVLESVEGLSDNEGLAESDLWFTLVTLGSKQFKRERYLRVLKRLNNLEDFEFRSALARMGTDHAMLSSDLPGLLAGLGESSVGGARRTLTQLSSMLVQRRVPDGLSDFGDDLTQREQFSLASLNQLLFHRGFFDNQPNQEAPESWVLGWLLGAEHREPTDIDRAFQLTHNDAELGSLVALVTLVSQPGTTMLTRIQTQHLIRRSPLLGQMKLMQTLWSNNRPSDLGKLLKEIDNQRPSSIPGSLTTFRKAEVLELEGHLLEAAQQFEALLEQEPTDWLIWAATVRLTLKMSGAISETLRTTMPVSTLDERGRLVTEAWLSLEMAARVPQDWADCVCTVGARLTEQGIPCDTSLSAPELLARLREVVLAPSLSVRRFRVYPVEPHNDRRPSLHCYVALEWLLAQAPGQTTEAQLHGLLSSLADEPDAYGVALRILRNNCFNTERVDEVLCSKLPQQFNTLLAASERIVRRRFMSVGVEETGDLAFLIGRRLQPGIGHELVSLRAWTIVLSTNDWVQAMDIWASLLAKSVGCLSAELGMVCGFVHAHKTKNERRSQFESLESQLSNGGLKRVLKSWSTLIETGAGAQSSPAPTQTVPTAHAVDDILQDCVSLYGSREVEALSNALARLERAGCSKTLHAMMSAHLAKAQELSGDILSAFRTHERIAPSDRCQISNVWLKNWLRSDPSLPLAESLVGHFESKDTEADFGFELGQLYWSNGQTASAIRMYTPLLNNERYRLLALNELGANLAEHGRRREAAQFYVELARTTRSNTSRRKLLKDALEWFESEGAIERIGEVLELLYREYVGDYQYVARAKSLFLRADQANELADFYERIRSLSLSSADQVSLELVVLYSRRLGRMESAKRVCTELLERAFHLKDDILKQLAEETTDLGLWTETATVYEYLVDRSEHHVDAFEMFAYRLASIQQDKLQDLEGARAVLSRILMVKPNASDALERLAYLSCLDGSSVVTARAALKQAIDVMERGQSRAALLVRLAELESEAGELELSIQIRHAALSDAPGDLVLVGSVVQELVSLGREREAGATLLKYELLNQGRVIDTNALDRIRELLDDVEGGSDLDAIEGSNGGVLIIKQLLEQNASEYLDRDEVQSWLHDLRESRVEDLSVGLPFCNQVRGRTLDRLLAAPRNGLMELLFWLDSVFAVQPVSDPNLPSRPLEGNTRYTGAITQIQWAVLPLHTAFCNRGTLLLSRHIRNLDPGVSRFLVQYFVELAGLSGLAFTRWSRHELLVMVEELCRIRLNSEGSADKDRMQIQQVLANTKTQDLDWALVQQVSQSLQTVPSIIEDVLGSALELALFASNSVETAFRAMDLLDESLGRNHRGSETLMTELLPRMMLRNQGSFGGIVEAIGRGD